MIRYGSADPTGADGVDGEYWINNTSHYLFGPKAAGVWPAGVSLVGSGGSLPEGGTIGQILLKNSSANGDAGWGDLLKNSTVWFSNTDYLGAAAADSAGNYTNGVEFYVTRAATCTGVRFKGFVGRNYKVSLWNLAGTRLATINTGALGASGIVSQSFSSGVSLAAYTPYRISVWNGTNETKTPIASRPIAPPYTQNPWVFITSNTYYTSADAYPNSITASGAHPLEPILT